MLALLPGERLLERCEGVKHLLVGDASVQGVLFFTSFRVAFVPTDPTIALAHPFHAFQVPLLTIIKAERRARYVLAIIGKDVRTNRLDMRQADWFRGRNQDYKQLKQAWDELLKMLAPPEHLGLCFAFDYSTALLAMGKLLPQRRKADSSIMELFTDGWRCYSPEREYTRLGLLSCDPGNKEFVHEFRLLKNKKYQLCTTYPLHVIVPLGLSYEQLQDVAHVRKLSRLPVAVWRHPVHKGVLVRGSAPKYRIWRRRNKADEKLLSLYRDAANGGVDRSSQAPPPLHIIDTRASSGSHRNLLRGESVEKAQRYDNAVIEFLGLASIRKVRDSFDALKELVSNVKDGDRKYHYRLDNTQWLDYIMQILLGSSRVAQILNDTGASVVVHGANGWDCTPQISSLAQLILDPYYRTIRGFAVLVEKEWCSFGHKFEERLGFGNNLKEKPTERCAVMLQFVDCVWQMTNQFPTSFEFNEAFLFHVHDALISGLYGTFLYDSERKRTQERLAERTQSAWTRALEDPTPFTNPFYRRTTQALFPHVNLKRIVLWDAMYYRWDPDSQPNQIDDEDDSTASSVEYDAPSASIIVPRSLVVPAKESIDMKWKSNLLLLEEVKIQEPDVAMQNTVVADSTSTKMYLFNNYVEPEANRPVLQRIESCNTQEIAQRTLQMTVEEGITAFTDWILSLGIEPGQLFSYVPILAAGLQLIKQGGEHGRKIWFHTEVLTKDLRDLLLYASAQLDSTQRKSSTFVITLETPTPYRLEYSEIALQGPTKKTSRVIANPSFTDLMAQHWSVVVHESGRISLFNCSSGSQDLAFHSLLEDRTRERTSFLLSSETVRGVNQLEWELYSDNNRSASNTKFVLKAVIPAANPNQEPQDVGYLCLAQGNARTHAVTLLQKNTKSLRDLSDAVLCSIQLASDRRTSMEVEVNARTPLKYRPDWYIPEEEVEICATPFSQGSFGTVHRGYWGFGTPVVIKRLIVGNKASKRALHSFMREVKIWHKLNHPHVVKLFGACHDSMPPFFVCEDAELGNLDDFLYSHDKAKTMIWRLLYQASLGLAYLHHKKIVHGDLKCNNILIGADKKARLGDFGLSFIRSESKTMSKHDQSGAIQWVAPECLTGEVENPLFASDVYSLGMCIIEAFTGQCPWGNRIDHAVMWLVARGRLPPAPENMSDEGWKLVKQMCANDHTQRISVAEVVKRLQELAEKEEEEQESAETKEIRFCRKCFARNSSENRFCGSCASELDTEFPIP